jgi:AraC-like DNA-binding protein
VATFDPLPRPDLDATLAAAETALGVIITVRDLTGWLRGADGQPLLPIIRNSHQRQAVCAGGFAAACIAHCRQATTSALRGGDGGPCHHSCWKGVREVVVPVVRGSTLHGYLFAGAWRVPGVAPEGVWAGEWRRLPVWSPSRAGEVAAVLALLADGMWVAAEHLRAAPPAPGPAGRIRAYVAANLGRSLGRAGLARELGLSSSRTSHVVNEACGCSLQELVARERVAAAQRLLADGDDPVAAVGARVGWADPPHFTRMFRRFAGLPPGEWRRRHRLA